MPVETSETQLATYRFAAFGGRGTITLFPTKVHVKTRTHHGWWEQTMPLAHLNSEYATLKSRPVSYALYWLAIGIETLIGSWMLIAGNTMGDWLIGALHLIGGGLLAWLLYRCPPADWIMFMGNNQCVRVSYTRQGPDAAQCEHFTEQLASAIQSKQGT